MSKPIIQDIGILDAEVLYFCGGSYSNIQSWQAFYEIYQQDDRRKALFHTGDVLGYCADPLATYQAVKDSHAQVVAGNVERQLQHGEADCGCGFSEDMSCNILSSHWFSYCLAHTNNEMKRWFSSLADCIKFQWLGKSFSVIHGGFPNNHQFLFEFTPDHYFQEIIQLLQTDYIVAGHCGLHFEKQIDETIWFNPGALGMPANNHKPCVYYGIMEKNSDKKIQAYIIELNYEWQLAKDKMEKNNLPSAYSNTLATGLWDNEEVFELGR